MDINRAALDALFTGFKQNFANGLGLAPTSYQQFALVVPSATSIEEYPFLEQVGGMREWVGPRQVKNLAGKKLRLENRLFEDTVGVPRTSIEDDRFGVYAPLIAAMGAAAGRLWEELAFAAMCANANWLDDAAFFGTSRKYGKATISNYTASALSAATYATARTAMMNYVGHAGKPLGVIPDLLIVGAANEAMGRRIVENNFWYDATEKVPVDNPWKGTAKLLVSPMLAGTYANYWFLACTNGPLRPVLVQQREQPVLVCKDKDTDANVFNEDTLEYGSRARGAAALSMPHLLYGGLVSA